MWGGKKESGKGKESRRRELGRGVFPCLVPHSEVATPGSLVTRQVVFWDEDGPWLEERWHPRKSPVELDTRHVWGAVAGTRVGMLSSVGGRCLGSTPPGLRRVGSWLTWNCSGWEALLGVRGRFWVTSSWHSFWEVQFWGNPECWQGRFSAGHWWSRGCPPGGGCGIWTRDFEDEARIEKLENGHEAKVGEGRTEVVFMGCRCLGVLWDGIGRVAYLDLGSGLCESA